MKECKESSAKSILVKCLERDLSAKEQLKKIVTQGLNEEDSCGSDFENQELVSYREQLLQLDAEKEKETLSIYRQKFDKEELQFRQNAYKNKLQEQGIRNRQRETQKIKLGR